MENDEFVKTNLALTAASNAIEQTVGTSYFKKNLLKLLPENYTPEQKEEFYKYLADNKIIIQTTGKGKGFTVLGNAADKFSYKKDAKNQFLKYLNQKFRKDTPTRDKIWKFYNSQNKPWNWGGTYKNPRTNKRKSRKNKRKKSIPK